jgi:hypothetical protein
LRRCHIISFSFIFIAIFSLHIIYF